jgi:hypothetical protein
MIIDNKAKEIGINEDVVLYLLNKTKHKEAMVSKVILNSIDYYGNYCLKLEMIEHWRKEITLHISDKKLKKLRRELIINILLN